MPADVKELMQRYVGGDASAFRDLYRVAGPPLLGYLTRLCGQKSLADDLLQQTFMKVHRARGAFVLGADPMPWMYSIAHRTFLDEARRRKRAKVNVSATSELPEVAAQITGQTIEQSSQGPDPELRDAALLALQQLPEAQRTAVVLTKLSGKSISEAADIAGISVGAMKVRAHRGYEMLRKLLKGGLHGA
jgi:RNA polymerase sigma factor (sigma-70 family)